MSSAGRWVLGLLLLLVGAVAVARTISSSDGSQAGKKDAAVQTQTVSDEKAAQAAAAAVSADVVCKKPCIDGKELVDEAVTTAKLAPGSITLSKLAFDVPNLTELQAEIAARQNAERTLQQALTNAAANSQSADAATLATAKAATDAAVANEALDRKTADDAINAALAQEKVDRAAGDTANKTALDAEIAKRAADDATLTTNLNAEIAARGGAITDLRNDLLLDSDALADKHMSVNTIEIVDGAVTTAKIANDTITDVHIADNILTKLSLATGSVESDEIANDTITDADVLDNGLTKLSLGTGSVESDEIANDTITDADVLDNALTKLSLGTGSVESDEIANDTITDADVFDNALTALSLATNSVGADELADNAVDTGALLNDAVTKEKIFNGSVTDAKLDPNGLIKSFNDFVLELSESNTDLDGNDPTVHWDNVTNAPAAASDLVCSKCVDDSDINDNAVTDAKISAVDAGKVTTGILDAARIPDLDAGKIATGTLDAARIPDLSAAKITSGTLDAARLPTITGGMVTTVDADGLTGANIKDGTIGANDLATGVLRGTHLGSTTSLAIVTNAGAGHIGLGTITGEEPPGDGSPTGNLAFKTVGAANLADGAVTADKLTANASSFATAEGSAGLTDEDEAAGATTPVTVIGDGIAPHNVLLTGEVVIDCTGCVLNDTFTVVVKRGTSPVLTRTYTVSGSQALVVLPISTVDTGATAAVSPGTDHTYGVFVTYNTDNTTPGAANLDSSSITAVDLGQ